MTAALDGAQRAALNDLIQAARSLLEADLDSTLEGDFGIHHSDGRIEETEALSLDASEAAVRIDLLDIIAFLRSEGESEPAAVERLVREAAFTHVNRLVALRVAEGIGILPEAIGKGLASQGFRDFAEIAPASADEEWERFRLCVRICADELSADVPALFDPRNPLLELEPSTAAFSELIELFVAADETIWTAPDALGWSYQFFNTAEERKEMRESSAPRNSRELAVRNQFFTPSYVVEFLVQNGLGAHLAASFPALADEMPLLVEAPERRPKPIDLREVSALDPACGSGHFLLGAYDVLEAAWRHVGVEPEDAAPDIVRSLWGIDIDPRATQIAQAAVILRARRHYRGPLPKPNVICARSLPTTPEAEDLIATLPSHIGRVVRAISHELVMAPLLGPLLKIEERLDREARDAFGSGQFEGILAEGLSEHDAANVESLVLETLAVIADQTTSTASQRLFVAEAHDAVRFVEAMSRRYTACLMNPPFGSPIATTKAHLKAAYPWIPATSDLFALFVGRGMELASSDGTTAAITSRTGLFLSSFMDWRADVLYANELTVVADLGERVMEEAMVEAAAYVMNRKQPGRPPKQPVVIRAVTSDDRSAALRTAVNAVRRKTTHELVFRPDSLVLSSIAGHPFAYWATAAIVRELTAHRPFEPSAGVVRQGLATGDDFRFVRCWWEVSEQRSTAKSALAGGADASTQLKQGCRWAPIIKGGSSQPWFSPVLLALIIHESGGLGGSGPRKSPSDLRRCMRLKSASSSSGGHLRGET
ncbi:Eco57I restriction-modification methylase domain-containing protein [Candidatus Poriferisodalis sp.]|uniref:Eco57I restriction-modification methylase domain-containing protein n=1 Tax=Candidatus Poriferisodalis sp. TaxID=3101277 RepID=UPI003B0161AD